MISQVEGDHATGPLDVLLRDDDTSFFTSPGAIERLYHDLWTRGPVTLAVIPYVHGTPQPFVPESHRHTAREYALGDNRDLVEFLRGGLASERLAVALHGCTHEDVRGTPEFVGGDGLAERIRRGRGHLEDVLGARITTFVPPHNRLSTAGYRAVRAAGLNLLNLPSVRAVSRPLSGPMLRTVAARIWCHAVWRCEYPRPVYMDGHWEVGCQPLGPRSDLAGVRAAAALCRARGWPLALATHYWEAGATLGGDGTVHGGLREMLSMTARVGPVRLVSPDQIFAAAAL